MYRLTQNYKTFIQLAVDHALDRPAEAFRDACTLLRRICADDIFAPATTTDFTPYMEQIANSGADASSSPGLARASSPWFRLLPIRA